jgi:hypothetical protein
MRSTCSKLNRPISANVYDSRSPGRSLEEFKEAEMSFGKTGLPVFVE